MSAREEVLRAYRALSNGSGKLTYFQRRRLSEATIKGAWIGYSGGEFLYPCISRTGELLALHYKGETRNGKGKRSQRWACYAGDLPPKGHGKNPEDPAKVIPFGLETLEGLGPGYLVLLCCGEEDALSLRQAGYTALSQPGAGLLEPAYASEFRGLDVADRIVLEPCGGHRPVLWRDRRSSHLLLPCVAASHKDGTRQPRRVTQRG